MDKQAAIILSALLILSLFVLIAEPSLILRTNAQPVEVETYMHLVANCYEGNVGTIFTINVTVEPPPPLSSDYFNLILVNISKPDRTWEALAFAKEGSSFTTITEPKNAFTFNYTGHFLGTFTFTAYYTGDTFVESKMNYLPSTNQIKIVINEPSKPQLTQITSPMPSPTQTPTPTPTASLPPKPTPPPQDKKIATLSIETEHTDQTINSPLTIKGRLWAPETVGIAVQDIIVSYQLPGESMWTLIGSPMTNEWGKYDFRWTPPAGTFVLKVEWAGNCEYYPASNTTTISTISIEDQQALIQSNSTITQITYKETVGLSFTLSGETGTKGYATVVLPQSLMPQSQKIKVYIDEKAAPFDLSENSEWWVIGFTYSHSIHQVLVTTKAENQQDNTLVTDNIMWITAGIVAAALAIIAGVIVWLAKTKEK
ncbi:MAG: hypothetical protein ACQCN5_07060 [Candidatus Bathyarchaeia archaeon]